MYITSGHNIKQDLQLHKTWQSPIGIASTAHFTLHISMYNWTNCDPLHVKICPVLHYIFSHLWVENRIFNKFKEIDFCWYCQMASQVLSFNRFSKRFL